MSYIRKNVWELGSGWAEPILWYARGVKAMKALALADTNSWRFYGGIHGFDKTLWTAQGYLSSSDKMPSSADQALYWLQCQHGSWYFLPWHRGYIIAFEAIVRAHIVALKGPADWALPYWNYFNPKENILPLAFQRKDWPDGATDNPLFVTQRFGPKNNGDVYIPMDQVNLKAMTEPQFTGVPSGGSRGFGGVDTGFEHGGPYHGLIEQQPHDMVHVLVGGSDPKAPKLPGLMTNPITAGLDPIFWLHHANIDRLWEVWRLNPKTHLDPGVTAWVNGPGSGQRKFSLPIVGGKQWNYTPGDMSDFSKLDYTYDDLSPQAAPKPRLLTLGATPAVSAKMEATAMPAGHNVELVGANHGPLKLTGTEARTSVQLDAGVRRKVSASLTAAATAAEPSPDRVFLNLENIRGASDATAFQVYVDNQLAGSVGLFGVSKASVVDDEHAGQGLTHVLEITDIVDQLHLNNALDVNSLDVHIVPLNPVPDEDQISIGRVSVFRQGN